MKKRLFRNLLMLGLLLVALTVMASAFTVEVNGKKVKTTLVIEYSCGICKTHPMLDDEDYTINSFQAYTADGTPKPLAEWKYNDGLVLSVTIKNTSCSKCRTNGVNTPIQGGTFNVVIDAAHVGYYCHKQFAFIKVEDGDFQFRFSPVDYLFTAEHHAEGPNSCEEDGYKKECWLCPCCGQCLDAEYTGTANVIPDNIIPKLGHKFDDDGGCMNAGCPYRAEAYISHSWTEKKTYYDTVANAISNATAPAESVHVVSYKRSDPITINKIVDLTVAKDVTVPEIRMESFSSGNTGDSVNINNYGTVNLFSSVTTVPSRYPGVSYTNHNVTERITAASTIAVQVMQISNKDSGTIGEINIPQTDNPTPKVQVTNNGGKIERLTGSPKNVELRSGTGRYGTITTAAEGGSVDSLLNKGCYFYFPNGGQKWVNSNAGKTVSDVIVSNAPFTVKVNRDGTALTASNGSYNVEGVNVGEDVALSAVFTSNENGLTADESKITSRWYYKNESKTAADGKALTLNNIQYGVYDLIFEAKESTYGFTTSISVTVNVIPPAEKTAISLKTQLTSDEYTKVYDGTTKASEILPPIEFQLADEREIRIPADCYTFKAEYASPDCITDNKIIVEVTLTEEGEKYYTLTDSKIEVPATITPYDGEWYDGVQHYKAFFVGLSDAGYDGSASIGRNVLPYLQLKGNMYDAVKKELSLRNITPEDGFQYSFYHLRPGAKEPDPELDELLTADSVFTYPEDEYHFYAVVKPSLNYAECITDTSHFKVRDTYSGAHTHDSKTYAAWDGSSLSIASGGTATRYLSGAQANVNVELVLSQKKTLDLCLNNKAVHVIGSSHD